MKRIFQILFLLFVSCNIRDKEPKDDFPKNLYWQILNDTLGFSINDTINKSVKLDSSNDFSVLKGSFFNLNSKDCLVKRSFIGSKGNRFQFACLFSIVNNDWKFKRWISADTVISVDIDSDGILELFSKQSSFGNGSLSIENELFSLKNNSKTVIFANDSYDNENNGAAFEKSKIGDTLVDISKYSFKSIDNKPFELLENREVRVLKSNNKKEGLDLKSSFFQRSYRFTNNHFE